MGKKSTELKVYEEMFSSLKREVEHKPKLDPSKLYLGDNGRAFCGMLRHAGQSAFFTGFTISGLDVLELTPEQVKEYGIKCEDCAMGLK